MAAISIADRPPEPEQAGAPDLGCALAVLADPALDPLFRPQARSGVASAWHAHVPFAQWLISASRPALIVELGTHNGVSYAAFCETVLREKLAARCYAVDSWTGDDHAGHYDDSVHARLRAFHDSRYSAFSELLRMSFDEALGTIADGTVDLLHIDGFHSYDAVRHDFESWAPKLSPRGVVLFHDINVLERDFGVVRFWAEVEHRFPSFSFLHGHGLGVLAVGPAVPPAVGQLCGTVTPSAVATLRERFATIGRVHALDYALRESARHEQRLRREADERDAVVESLRRSLDDVVRHRDEVLAAQALADRDRPDHEATIASLRLELSEAQASLDDVTKNLTEALATLARLQVSLDEKRDEAARAEAAAQDRERQIVEGIGDLRTRAAEDRAECVRVAREIDALRDHLAAARADAKAAREHGRVEAARLQAEIDQRDGELAVLRAAARPESIAARAGLRPRRH